MGDDVVNKPLTTTVRCGDCGASLRDFAWSPGSRCPRCGSRDLAPAPVIRRGSDYAAADRSQGFALEDVRFGRLAQWAEFITPKQFQHALYLQKEMARAKRSVPDLGSLLVQEKTMNRRQVKAILAVRCATPGSREDDEFARAALHNGLVTEVQLEEGRKLQVDAARDGRDVPPLPLLLYEKRHIQEKLVLTLLKAAERQDKGLLHQIRVAAEGAGTPGLGRLLSATDSPLRRAPVIGVAALLAIMVGLWAYRFAGGGAYATVECAGCHAVGGAPANSKWPVKCPECGQNAMYPLAVCLDCGKRFPVAGVGYGTGCPECGATRYKMITSNLDLDRIEAEIAADNEDGKRD